MKITQKSTDDLTLIVTLAIEKEDYTEKRKKILSDYRRKADIKGFRKGMAPMSFIEKTHGRAALLDAVNGVISDGLNNYITENNLNIIGEPLPNESEQKPIDWESDEQFEVSFDLAMAPKVEINLTSKDKIPYYEVEISEQDMIKYRSNLLKQYGQLVAAESVEEEDFIVADLVQEGTTIEGAYIALRSIADAKIKKSFIGKKSGDEFAINVNKAFENETDRAALLKVKKEELAALNPEFNVVIKEVKRFEDAQMNEELYDRMFGAGVVKSEQEFNEKIVERIKSEYTQESDYRFMLDARDALIEKAAIALPEQFLKRWLHSANEGKFSMEEIEKDFPLFLKDFRWQMVRQFITKEQDIKLTRENLLDHARKIAAYQFAMYGLNNAPAEQIDHYAETLLANEKEGKRIYEKVEDDLVLEYVRSVVTLDKKGISIEKLHELTK
ncbi:MAG: trigger factor [Bacteroidetes bacterium GWF2_41_61]|nr:MAG: trigger factor [Bacteroidetes bacterium GWE2_40_15]OFY34692.1 MAG: trigger factor [Bacteroidetes bacterium GWF2_41_61]HBG23554.1 trigger factor [Rikenellaceae bacterium]HBZ25899.1 trigger factor [Rikenellaceae bacterium]